MHKIIRLLTCCFIFSSTFSHAAPEQVFAFDDDGAIWGFDFLDEKTLFVSQRSGKLHLVDLTSNTSSELIAPAVKAKGQGGLLDVKVIDIEGQKYLYATYSKRLKSKKITTALARAVVTTDKPLVWQDLFVAKAESRGAKHFGSRLLFVEDTVFMTIGDRGERDLAQDLTVHNGKVLRLTLSGEPVSGNPFVNNPDALPEIWTLGHRNPQGIAYDQTAKQVYVAEFGPRGGDEINAITAGNNYGWPLITYGKNYIGTSIGPSEREGLEQPLVYWNPSVSPSGMVFVNDGQTQSLLLACLSDRTIKKLTIENDKVVDQQALFDEPKMRFRHVAQSPDKRIYFSTDDGKIYRL
jgi:glucose/arabinose dehydrogenase